MSAAYEPRNDLRTGSDIFGKLRSPQGDQVSLEEENSDHDVDRQAGREDEVADRHRRRHPERHDESEEVGVAGKIPEPLLGDWPADLVVFGRIVRDLGVFPILDKIDDLIHAEYLPVADQDRRPQHGQPAGEGDPLQDQAQRRILHVPDHIRDRPPLPLQQCERDDREDDVGRALEMLGNDPCPYLLERRPGHAGVLKRQKQQKADIDRQRDPERLDLAHVDRLPREHVAKRAVYDRIEIIADKADGVEQYAPNTDDVDNSSVEKGKYFLRRMRISSGVGSANWVMRCPLQKKQKTMLTKPYSTNKAPVV